MLTNRQIKNDMDKYLAMDAELKAMQKEIEALKELMVEQRARVVAFMEDAGIDTINTGEYKIRYKMVTRMDLDRNAMKADNVYDKYLTKATVYPTFDAKPVA